MRALSVIGRIDVRCPGDWANSPGAWTTWKEVDMRKYTEPCPDCGRTATRRGLCGPCYYKRKYHGIALPPKQETGGDCSVADCQRQIKGHGWCGAHLIRWRKYGDPLGGLVRIPTALRADDAREWRSISGFEGRYEVSNLGDVRSLASVNGGGRVLKPYTAVDGYHLVDLFGSTGARRRAARVHCLVLEAFVGPRPDGMYGCHNDGNPQNNLLSNLRWDTPRNNSLDKVIHGRDYNANKDHCPHRHLLREPNLCAASFSEGHRGCLACHRASGLNRARARRGLPRVDVRELSDQIYGQLMRGEPAVLTSRGSDGRFARAAFSDSIEGVGTGG